MDYEEKKQRLENYRYLVLEKDSLIQSSDTCKRTSTSIIVIENDKSKNALRSKPSSIIELDSERIKEIDIELKAIRNAIDDLKAAKHSLVLKEKYIFSQEEVSLAKIAEKLSCSDVTVKRLHKRAIELLKFD